VSLGRVTARRRVSRRRFAPRTDDIGHVLSFSPMLMEKYMAAAHAVSHAAVFGAPYQTSRR
jgi:hypothetical protein